MLKMLCLVLFLVPLVYSQTAIEVKHYGDDNNGMSTYSRVISKFESSKIYRIINNQKKENRIILYMQSGDKGSAKVSPISVVITYMDYKKNREYYLYSWLFWYTEKDPLLVVNGIVSLMDTIREHEKYKALLNASITK